MTKENLKRIYAGWLDVKDCDESTDVLFLSSIYEPLAEALEYLSGKQVSVRYWISNKEASIDDIQEQAMKQIIGAADVEFGARYSEVTGYLWTDECLKIGGHDLLEELTSSKGKYLVLEVEIHAGVAE